MQHDQQPTEEFNSAVALAAVLITGALVMSPMTACWFNNDMQHVAYEEPLRPARNNRQSYC